MEIWRTELLSRVTSAFIDNCGSSYKGDGQFEINSIGYSEDQECVDLTLLANYNGKVAVRLDYFIDKAKLR